MKHFLELSEWSAKELRELLDLAVHLKREWRSGGNRPVLAGKILGMVFQKPSLRTRVSFEVGMKHLGGDAIMLGPSEIGLGKRESIGDVARVLSGYVQGIMARVFDHQHVVELAQYASVPVINGLSDDRHPCQAMADMLTIYEHFGRLEGLKFAFIGDGNNVAQSSLLACAQFGLDYAIASPEGYELPSHFLDKAAPLIQKSGINIQTLRDPIEAVQNADVIYTDTWVSMGQEEEVKTREAKFAPYQVNAQLLTHAKPHVVVLHCLPAHRGQEIADEVADGKHSLIFPQAENRLHAQKAILVKLMG
ncbi:MAG: ornithine carbamoyltransferase [Phototrophicales bacterium]|nr:MAG: ornithine carbamoyltransferase [Phototrophicales bacterium]RMG71902.1 MAG: ornithine carbamoyltransferase [Chloroflexota bacterium]